MATTRIDRSALKATSVAKSQEADELLSSKLSDPSRTEYLKIADGSNIFRIFPPHPDSGYTFTVPRVVHRLPILVDELDDKKNKTGKKIFIYKSVFNSKVHGDAPNDLIEEYKRLAEEKARRISSNSDTQKEYLRPIYGFFSKDKTKSIQGITPQETWICYASKIVGDNVINGRLEIKKAVKNRLNQISALETDGDPLGTDPFTDPDDGRAIKIVYNSNADKPQDYYQVEIYAPTIKGSRGQIQLFPLTDEQLDWFSQVTPLSEIYQKCFTRRDFELQLEGLQNFDKMHKMGIFESEEFLEIVDFHDNLWEVVEDSKEEEESEEDELPFKKSSAFEKIIQRNEAISKNRASKIEESEDNEANDDRSYKKPVNQQPAKKIAKEENELPWSAEEEKPVFQAPRVKPPALMDDEEDDNSFEEVEDEKPKRPEVKESIKDRLARLKAEAAQKK